MYAALQLLLKKGARQDKETWWLEFAQGRARSDGACLVFYTLQITPHINI